MNNSTPPTETRPREVTPQQVQRELPAKVYDSGTLLVLFYDRWFRFAAFLFLLILLTVALGLPKLWKVTPPDMPVVKISGLDKVQAWALRRAALRQTAEGKLDEALLSWRSAVDNSPADLELLRSYLTAVTTHPIPPREILANAYARSTWLLGLSHTNGADVGLFAKIIERMGYDDYLVRKVLPSASELTPQGASTLVKALFRSRKMEQFDKVWKQHESTLTNDPTAMLYRYAWVAGWGRADSGSTEGRAILDHAMRGTDPEQAKLAHQLSLYLSRKDLNLNNYRRSLEWLVEHHEDRFEDNLGLWKLLLSQGLRNEASQLAKSYSKPPSDADDAMGMVEVLVELGLKDDAIKFLEAKLPVFPYYQQLWLAAAELTISLKRWDDLFSLANQIRRPEYLGGSLNGYSYYLEGLAALNRQQTENAEKLFKTAAENTFENGALAFNVARGIREAGYPAIASSLLRQVQDNFKDKAEFWHEVSIAAIQQRDTDTMVNAAQKAYELAPDKNGIANNYVGTLLILRKNPGEALTILNRLLAVDPRHYGLLINKAEALMQVGRHKDAGAILASLDTRKMSPSEFSELHFALAELNISRGDLPAAKAEFQKVDKKDLFPQQVQWIEQHLR
jgi:tetratricopeptide (TPR) repeat protein